MRKGLSALIVASILIFTFVICGAANARVKGVCQACHTMHNSQGGQPMAKVSYVSSPSAQPFWSGNAINTGAANTSTPNEELLRADCIGCHSNTGTQTIVSYMGNKVPIVHNTQKPAYEVPGANNALAGGNFYWTDPNSGGDFADNHGHNVFSQDQTLSSAPGLNDGNGHCPACHQSLYGPIMYGPVLTGCQACHYNTWHHKKKGASGGLTANVNMYGQETNLSSTDPTYRFLSAPITMAYGWGTMFVEGIEDPNFEQSPSVTAHNVYMANGASVSGAFVGAPSGVNNSANHSLSGFCAGCHGVFHEDQKDSGNVWIRHPVDVLVSSLVNDGHEAESFFYNGPNGYGANKYDPAVPVAYDIANPYGDFVSSYSTVDATHGQVTCVSCHRTHASPYPSMLRFNYNMMIAGNGTTAGGNGCFACHTEKALE